MYQFYDLQGYPVYPLLPSYYPTFVAATNTSAMTPMASPAPAPAPAPPPPPSTAPASYFFQGRPVILRPGEQLNPFLQEFLRPRPMPPTPSPYPSYMRGIRSFFSPLFTPPSTTTIHTGIQG